MSRGFKTYEEASAYAQAEADRYGFSHGLSKPAKGSPYAEWTVFMLPRPENRYGQELHCQVVVPAKPHPSYEADLRGYSNLTGRPS